MWPFKRAGATAAVIDPCLGDETARRLLEAAGRGDWHAVGTLLAPVEDQDLRAFYVGVLADRRGPQPWLGQWLDAEPQSALPHLVKGAHAIQWAWEARGNGTASTVSEAQFAAFFHRLKIAEDSLDEAVSRDPDDATAWAELITTAIGRQLGTAEAERRFKEVVARHRWHRSAHARMLQQKCAKWGGSDELALAFARDTVEQMPAGCTLGSMVAVAHFEAALQADGRTEDYLARPEVLAEVHAAADKSVRHPQFRRIPGHQTADGWFALVFLLAGEHAAAAERFDAIGDRPTELPWGYYRDAGRAYAQHRAKAYRAAGRG
ncbi:hypothetical protein GCM10020358_23180 [Amorphoplanes nipponensis]|uniref:DUF4034 domain-containing protein n=2 Tax=Actinoplanes nipponensis TaxID=135950 RepID=A0A919JH33_9ACTN|nr:hypothetical protein Ani05nite_30570 [Actinoplanes nipponensis]